jgi:uncharacterized protein (TIGR02996 family)
MIPPGRLELLKPTSRDIEDLGDAFAIAWRFRFHPEPAMHTDRAAFLAAILDRPDDDLPRLVYADWLDEHGEPERAEFIRTQCGHITAPAGD